MKAVVYLQKSFCDRHLSGIEMEARALAARYGYSVARTVVECETDTLSWLLVKAKALNVDVIVTPTMQHIQHRANDVLTRCDLLIVYPKRFVPRGTRLALGEYR